MKPAATPVGSSYFDTLLDSDQRLFERLDLFVLAVDEVFWLYTHPLFKHRAVDAAEVDGVAHVFVVEPVLAFDRRIFGVETSVHVLTNDECASARAVVCAAAVVLNPAAEFGEHEDGHLFGCIVLAEVGQEVGDSG